MSRLAGEIEHIKTRVIIITEEIELSEILFSYMCIFCSIIRMLQKANYIELMKSVAHGYSSQIFAEKRKLCIFETLK